MNDVYHFCIVALTYRRAEHECRIATDKEHKAKALRWRDRTQKELDRWINAVINIREEAAKSKDPNPDFGPAEFSAALHILANDMFANPKFMAAVKEHIAVGIAKSVNGVDCVMHFELAPEMEQAPEALEEPAPKIVAPDTPVMKVSKKSKNKKS